MIHISISNICLHFSAKNKDDCVILQKKLVFICYYCFLMNMGDFDILPTKSLSLFLENFILSKSWKLFKGTRANPVAETKHLCSSFDIVEVTWGSSCHVLHFSPVFIQVWLWMSSCQENVSRVDYALWASLAL